MDNQFFDLSDVKDIKTVVSESAAIFDNKVNAALNGGWELLTIDVKSKLLKAVLGWKKQEK